MIGPMTEEERARPEAEFAADIGRLVARLRREQPPRFDRVAPPINPADFRANSPGPLYEGFEEDITRMRRGLPPLGPRR